jgi:UDPglucose 6-dehydrogenase
MREIYGPMTSGSYYARSEAIPGPDGAAIPPPLIMVTTQSAELIKHACNAFLAMKISYINAVASVCDAVGADIEQVREGMGSDHRIGPNFLHAGIGYGGSCFPKDLKAFRAVARERGYEFRLLDEVMRINEDQREHFVRKVRNALWTLRGKRLAVLGLAFKGGTDDIRDSPAIALVETLVQEGCHVAAYDPAAIERSRTVLKTGVDFANNAYEAARGADALLILTEWEEFHKLDWKRIYGQLKDPIVIDGRNLLDPGKMAAQGFTYYSMGRPSAAPEGAAAEAATARKLGNS